MDTTQSSLMPAPRRGAAFGRRSASRRTAAYSGVREPASTGHGGRPVAPPRRAGRGPRGPLGTGAGAAPVRREQASAYRGGIGAAPWGVMRLSVLPLATLGVLAGGSALGQSPSPALGQGWAGELWSRGGAASSDAAGSTGAGLLDGSLSFSFDNVLTPEAELEGNGLRGSDGAEGTVQAWWEDPSLGLIGAFAEASRSDGLWQRRFVLQGELYLGPFTLRGQAGIAPPRQGGVEGAPGRVLRRHLRRLVSARRAWAQSRRVDPGRARPCLRQCRVGTRVPAAGRLVHARCRRGAGGVLLGLVGVRFVFGPGAASTVRGRQLGEAPGFPRSVVGAFGERRAAQAPPASGGQRSSGGSEL